MCIMHVNRFKTVAIFFLHSFERAYIKVVATKTLHTYLQRNTWQQMYEKGITFLKGVLASF